MGNTEVSAARIIGLFIYPVKSCGGIAVDKARLDTAGLEHDRRWMIVDATGTFLTQRSLPRLALIATRLGGGALELAAAGMPALRVATNPPGPVVDVRVWNDTCAAFDCGSAAADWLATVLGRPARLVRFDERCERLSDSYWTGGTSVRNAFSDGFPLLLIGEASLRDLNRRLAEPLPMNRFRPNIVVDGLDPYDEDFVATFTRDGVQLRPVKPCTRCAITTTDQDTAARGVEPLLTLAGYRHHEQLDGVVFGQNVIIAAGVGASLQVGDELAVSWNF